MSVKIANDTANGSAILKASNTATGDVTHTLPEFSTELAPRMQLMTAQNSTSGTSVDFTGIPSWAKKITVMFNGVSINGTSFLRIQLGTSGGIQSASYLGTCTTATTTVASLGFTDGFDLYDGGVATSVKSGNISFNNISNNSWSCSGIIGFSNEIRTCCIGGSIALSSTLDRIRITTVNGTDTFDAGQINIMYEG